jgi:hypothetical protein
MSYHPSLKSYGLPRMNDHKNLQAVFVTRSIKATGRLSHNGWMTTTLSLTTASLQLVFIPIKLKSFILY